MPFNTIIRIFALHMKKKKKKKKKIYIKSTKHTLHVPQFFFLKKRLMEEHDVQSSILK